MPRACRWTRQGGYAGRVAKVENYFGSACFNIVLDIFRREDFLLTAFSITK